MNKGWFLWGYFSNRYHQCLWRILKENLGTLTYTAVGISTYQHLESDNFSSLFSTPEKLKIEVIIHSFFDLIGTQHENMFIDMIENERKNYLKITNKKTKKNSIIPIPLLFPGDLQE